MMHAEVNMAAETLTRRGLEMQRLLERCERSGLSLAEFARRRGISVQTLAWWRHRLRRAHGGVPKSAVAFTEIVLGEPNSVGAIAEVVLRSGRILRVPLAGVEAEAVRVLVRVLEEPC